MVTIKELHTNCNTVDIKDSILINDRFQIWKVRLEFDGISNGTMFYVFDKNDEFGGMYQNISHAIIDGCGLVDADDYDEVYDVLNK